MVKIFFIGIIFFNIFIPKQAAYAQECSQFEAEMETLRACAEQGYVYSQHQLGLNYYIGGELAQDYSEAFKWFLLAAEQELAESQYALGIMYENGQGVSQDDAEAFKWYTLASQRGSVEALYSIGLLYANGKGVEQNYVYAYMFWKMASERGFEVADENIEILEGILTPEQMEEIQRLSKARAEGREWLVY